MPSRSWALSRHQANYLRGTAVLTAAYVLVPFVLIAYFRNFFLVYLRAQG
jgi:hypothetical protein